MYPLVPFFVYNRDVAGRACSLGARLPPVPMPTTVHYLGHATLMLQVDGVNILTDPVLGDRVLHLRRRHISGQAWMSGLPQPDLILLSHLHTDHLHIPTLRRLPRNIPIIVPRGTAPWLRRVIHQPLWELSPGEQSVFSGLTIVATLAAHLSNLAPALLNLVQGYIIQGSTTIYFPGDTDIFPQMRDIGDVGLDVALMPVWGWGPTLGPGHLNPMRAAQALEMLRPRVAIPIHWAAFRPVGRVWERMAYLHEPGPEFQRLAARVAPETEVHVLPPGASFTLV